MKIFRARAADSGRVARFCREQGDSPLPSHPVLGAALRAAVATPTSSCSAPGDACSSLFVAENEPGDLLGILLVGPSRHPRFGGAEVVAQMTRAGLEPDRERLLIRELVGAARAHLSERGIPQLWWEAEEERLGGFFDEGGVSLSRILSSGGVPRVRARLFLSENPVELRTERLLLRRWYEADVPRVLEMGQDPRVSEYLPGPLSGDESRQLMERLDGKLRMHGFGYWAVQPLPSGRASSSQSSGPFLGFVGLSPVWGIPPVTARVGGPALDLGWRLLFDAWGHGYATEAAQACLVHAFEELGVDEVVSYTAVQNVRSRRVMERLGLVHDANGDFDHPVLAPGHPLRRHVLYRKRRSW